MRFFIMIYRDKIHSFKNFKLYYLSSKFEKDETIGIGNRRFVRDDFGYFRCIWCTCIQKNPFCGQTRQL